MNLRKRARQALGFDRQFADTIQKWGEEPIREAMVIGFASEVERRKAFTDGVAEALAKPELPATSHSVTPGAQGGVLNPAFFIVPDALKLPPASDVEATFRQAAQENTAMNERTEGITDKFRAALDQQRDWCNSEIERIRGEQATADTLHADKIASLNAAIKEAEQIHSDLTAANDARIADANKTLAGITAADTATEPLPVDVMTNNGAFYDATKRTPMGSEFHEAWKDRYAEFPTDPTLPAEPGTKRLKAVPATAAEQTS